MSSLGGQPILILKEGSQRTRGRDAQSGNIAAAKAVASAVRTTLGPKGMDKMLVDTIGDVVITNDGVTILKEMDIEHPAAKMMVEIAKTQDDEVGDGTTTAVVIAGELLKRAEELLDQDVHPTVIAHGYRVAADKAQEILDNIAVDVKPDDMVMLQKLADTPDTKLHLSLFAVNRHHAYRTAQKILFCLELNKLSRQRRPRQLWSCYSQYICTGRQALISD